MLLHLLPLQPLLHKKRIHLPIRGMVFVKVYNRGLEGGEAVPVARVLVLVLMLVARELHVTALLIVI